MSIPQLTMVAGEIVAALEVVGARMAESFEELRASFDSLKTALTEGLATVNTTLTTELAQIQDALRAAAGDPAAVLAVIADMDTLHTNVQAGFADLEARISGIIPDAPPPGP